jgi:hypothetical protein
LKGFWVKGGKKAENRNDESGNWFLLSQFLLLITGNGFCFPDFCAVCAGKTNTQSVDRGPGKKRPAN